jgi:DNA-binding transcriptional regulator GbsR (MarR family)
MIFKDVDRQRAYEGMRRAMKHWGFGDACASIYALLAVSDEPLTAREISERVGYAYSSVINEINSLIREGLVERDKKGRKYVYLAVNDFLEIIRNERRRLMRILEETRDSLKNLKGDSMKTLLDNIDKSLKYLKEIERRSEHEEGKEITG